MSSSNPSDEKLSQNSLGRRRFIESAGIGLVAATGMVGGPSNNSIAGVARPGLPSSMSDVISIKLPPLEQPTEKEQSVSSVMMPPDKRIGYAIVGLGNLSLGQILPAFAASKYSKPVALVSGDAGKARKVAAQYGIAEQHIYSYQQFDRIAENPQIDAVYIVLPNSMHEEFVVRAAKAGKHVLCEKPMATSSREAQNMIDACKKADRKLMIAYRIQYEPYNKLAMQWTRQARFGKVKIIEMVNTQNIGDPAQWRLHKALSGGGSLPDIGLYCLNTCRYLLGAEPHTVMASSYSTPGDARFKEVEESVLWQLHFPGGAMVNSLSSYGVHQSRRYRCYGDTGGWFGLDPAFEYEGLKLESSHAEGNQEIKSSPTVKEQKQFALEMDHFSRCIIENTIPFTPGEEGLQDHKIMEAIYESAQTGKPVKLETSGKLDTFRGTPPKEDL
jgi:predicted dehydrogenase